MKNEYLVTFSLFLSWAFEGKFKGRRLKFFIMWCAFGLFYLGIAVGLRALISYLGYNYTIIFTLFSVLSAFSFYCAFLRDAVRALGEYERSKKRYKPLWIRSVSFNEENIIITDAEISLTYKYLDVTAISENKKATLLSMSDGTLIRLYHDKFEHCDKAECVAFIEKNKEKERIEKELEEQKKPKSAKS